MFLTGLTVIASTVEGMQYLQALISCHENVCQPFSKRQFSVDTDNERKNNHKLASVLYNATVLNGPQSPFLDFQVINLL